MISVIICTYNREKYIYNVLKSVADNDYPHDQYEIVLVNNNSTDSTESECRRFQSDYPNIPFRYCIETNQGLSYARNCGIRQSSGDLLAYVDDDATVNKEYLRTYADFFASHPNAVAAGGPILPVYETEEPAWMSHYTRQLITGKLYLGDKQREFPRGAFPGGGNACYRKSVFDTVGLFNVELGRKGNSLIGAEEKDLFDKMTTNGMHFFYLPNAILYHIIPPHKLTQEASVSANATAPFKSPAKNTSTASSKRLLNGAVHSSSGSPSLSVRKPPKATNSSPSVATSPVGSSPIRIIRYSPIFSILFHNKRIFKKKS